MTTTLPTHDRICVAVRYAMAVRRQSQADVARALGTSTASISSRFTGRVRWSVDDLDALAEHFGVTVGQLVDPRAMELLPPEGTPTRVRPRRRLVTHEYPTVRFALLAA